MSRPPLGNVLFNAIRTLLVLIFKLIAIAFAWACKIAGMILTKIGEATEKLITNR